VAHASTIIEIRSLAGFGIVFYGLVVMAGCIAYAVLLHNWLRDNAYQGERARLHGIASVALALGLFVAFAYVAHPA
jgi:hypothetical protein